MNEWRQDFSFLARFAREGDEAAFGDLVRRHLDLVYATALRKVTDEGAAQEVAQNVFSVLARKAWQFSPDDSLPAWLHRTALLESKHWLRGELRRRRREQTAAQLGTTMKTSDEQPAFRALLPLLDEALFSLREKERSALLLRFYERRSLREVGASAGISEDAAQKRVAAALDRLASFFQRRGFKTASGAAAAAALQQTASAVPAAVASSIISGVLHSAPPAITGLTALLARIAALPKTQTVLLCVLVVAAPASWEWNKTHSTQKRAANARLAVEAARAEQEKALAQTEHLRALLTQADNLAGASVLRTPGHNEEAARQFTGLKARVFNLLSRSDYSWPDDLPFVRVPKWALTNISSGVPAFRSAGQIAPWVQEVLNLSSEQVKEVESHVADYLSGMDRLAAGRASATNWISADGAYHESVQVPAIGEEGQILENALTTNLVNALGPDQTKLVLSPFSSGSAPVRELHSLIAKDQRFEMWVRPLPSGPPVVSMTWDGHISYGGPIAKETLAPFLVEQFRPWLEGNGLTNAVFSGEP